MNFLNIGKNLSQQSQAEQESEDRKREVEEFDLVGLGGFLNVVKYAVFAVLGALNFRLFLTVVPGVWGMVIAASAILFECFAIYCWNNINKSAGRHQKALSLIAYGFTGISFVHASASFYELIGTGPSLGEPLRIYSHYVAFPLLFTAMVTAVCALYATHWSSKVSKKQAETQQSMAIDRADLIRRDAKLKMQAEQNRAELAHYEEEMKTEAQFIELLRKTVTQEQEKVKLLGQIKDPHTRRRMADILERDLDGDGIADVLQEKALQAEARHILDDPKATPYRN